jgi:IMP dehydrogenase/GMP reductase
MIMKKESDENKINKAKFSQQSVQRYFQSSLSLEIIYTTLNALVQQIRSPDRSVIIKMKKSSVSKIVKLERT